MSAIAQLFNPPKLRHIPTRLIVSGMDVTSIKRLPPLPDDKDRAAVKKKIVAIRKKKWEAEKSKDVEYLKAKYAKQKEWREEKKKDPEYRKKRAMMSVEYHRAHKEEAKRQVAKWRIENRKRYLELKREGMRRLRARKKNEAMLAQAEQQNGG